MGLVIMVMVCLVITMRFVTQYDEPDSGCNRVT